MAVVIEKNVPIVESAVTLNALRSMEVGDSFLIEKKRRPAMGSAFRTRCRRAAYLVGASRRLAQFVR